jgi:RNA polymerase sigma factor CnrH
MRATGLRAVLPDAEMALDAVKPDTLAFTQLVSRHRDAVLRCIRRHVRGSDEAFDVLQETLLSAWLALAQYDRDRPFEVWIRAIALNKCRDRARRARVRAAISDTWSGDAMKDVADSAPGPADLLETHQALDRLQGSLAKLPRSLREPLLLTALEGMSHLQAGDHLSISAKAVESRIYRARVRLEQWVSG